MTEQLPDDGLMTGLTGLSDNRPHAHSGNPQTRHTSPAGCHDDMNKVVVNEVVNEVAVTALSPLRPDRIWRARADGICGLCGSGTRPGQKIGRLELDGRHYWAHLSCISERRQAATAEHASDGQETPRRPDRTPRART